MIRAFPCLLAAALLCPAPKAASSLGGYSNSPNPLGADTTPQVEQTHHSQEEVAPPGYDSANPSGFFGTIKEEGSVCKAQEPLLTIGRLGVRAFPFPSYQEEFGWDLAAAVSASLDEDADGRPAASLGVMPSYEQREDRVSGHLALSLAILRRAEEESDAGAILFDRFGRRGGGLQLSLGLSDADEEKWLTAQVGVLREEYLDMVYLGPADWSQGDRAWGFFDIRLWQPRGLLALHRFRISVHGALSLRDFGGDFSYRLIAGDLRWPHRHWEAWTRWGRASGQLPVQELFDLAIDAGLGGIPIHRHRTTGFQSLGAEGRHHLLRGLSVRPYAMAAHANGQSRMLGELGVGFTIGEDPKDYDPDDWFLRVDIPAYSSHGDSEGSREKWDLRRFMLRVNFAIPSLGRDKEIRYRYPGR